VLVRELHGTFPIAAGAGLKQCCAGMNFSTYQTGPGIRVFSFCFSPCLACTGMGYYFKNFIPLGVLCIPSNVQCATLQKYKTLFEMVIALYF